jgi:hypothetical protein
MDKVTGLLRRTRLAIQEFGPSMGMLLLPGGYLIALTGLLYRHWPLGSSASEASSVQRRAEPSAGDFR